MKYRSARSFIIEMMERELPENLTYHNVDHSKDVLAAVTRIAREECVNGKDLTMLKTAALFHDSGFIYCNDGHELVSCELARKYLPQFEYSQAEIKKICEMIMATRIPQTPHCHLEEILADADLDYLGRDDFFSISNKLYEEFLASGVVQDLKEWNEIQVRFFESHKYFTQTSRKFREKRKAHNLALIKSSLK